ncbi:MAG: inositol-3-phosphate synthase, partial [Candidatus Tectomicrobia bacterium]|nr:inositol-3-phosphate synthase [Candidatus Tectomicrobia bacterium]
MEQAHITIAPAQGKLGVLLPGMGAVSTTLIAGVVLVKKGLGRPVGSLTQYGTIRLGKRTDDNSPLIKDFVPLAGLDDLVFGGWDIFADNCYEAAVHAGVIETERLEAVRAELEAIVPSKAVFDQNYVKRLSGPHVKVGQNKYELAMQLMEDIEAFQDRSGATRMVMLWCGSTEIFMDLDDVHKT